MRIALAIVIAACGTPTRTAPPPPAGPPSTPTAPPIDAAVAPPLVQTSARKTKLEAPHGAAIRAIAATHDGRSAITADAAGGVRLWPALDASMEPRVVDVPAPSALAIGVAGPNYAIGTLDDSGGVGVAIVDRDGIVLQRAAIAGDPPYVAIAASDHGLIALRSDHEIHRIAHDGAIASRLASEPGTRIVGFAAQQARAIAAVVAGSGKPRLRWVSLSPLAWGAFVPVPAVPVAGASLAGELSLSPSGKRVLAVSRPSTSLPAQLLVVDTDTGAAVAHDTAVVSAAALVHDRAIALLHGSLEIRDVAKLTPKLPVPPAQPPPANPPPPRVAHRFGGGSDLAIGGGRALFGVHTELALQAPDQRPQYLSYELVGARVASPAPNGLAFANGTSVVQLDAQLAAKPLDLGLPKQHTIAELRWLEGTHWLVQTWRSTDSKMQIDLVDTTTKRWTNVAQGLQSVHAVAYEPSTKLATISLGGEINAAFRFDPAKGRLTKLGSIERSTTYERMSIVPVVPARANGASLVVIQMQQRLAIRWLRDASALDAGTPLALDGSLASVDSAGHVYVWQTTLDVSRKLQLGVYRDGALKTTMPIEEVTSFWPDPKGARIAQTSQRVMALLDPGGKRAWAQPAQGLVEVLWLDDGSLGLVGISGVARLDATTGEVLAARCGWNLALSPTPRQLATFAPLCTQLR